MTFYYTATEKETKYSFKVTLRIYKIVKKVPVFLCEHSFSSGSTKGERSEIFNGLAQQGFLPKKYQACYSREVPHNAYKL